MQPTHTVERELWLSFLSVLNALGLDGDSLTNTDILGEIFAADLPRAVPPDLYSNLVYSSTWWGVQSRGVSDENGVVQINVTLVRRVLLDVGRLFQ